MPYYQYFFVFLILSLVFGAMLFLSGGEARKPDAGREVVGPQWFRWLARGIFSVFIGITLYFPLFYSGTYVDEYFHIISGLELFSSGEVAETYTDGRYSERGMHISFLAGLMMSIFGETLFVAKLVPALLGILSFVMLYQLASLLLIKRYAILLLLLLFSLNPFLIFEHFFLRPYVLGEFLLLLVLYLFYRTICAIRNDDARAAILLVLGAGIINWLNLRFGYHPFEYMVAFASAVCVSYLFLFEVQHFTERKRNRLTSVCSRFLRSPFLARISVWAICLFAGFVLLDAPGKIHTLLNGQLTYGSLPNRKFDDFFFGFLPVFSVFAGLAVFQLFGTRCDARSSGRKMVILALFSLLLVHFISADGMQVLRSIFYLLPVFLLVGMFALEKLLVRKNLLVAASVILLVATGASYPRGFFTVPYVYGDMSYVDYQKAYDYVRRECDGKTLIESSLFPFHAQFHGIELDYVLTTTEIELQEKLFRKTDEGYVVHYTDVPVITGFEMLREKVPGGYCYIQSDPGLMKMSDPQSREYLEQRAVETVSFSAIRVFRK